jgi:glutamine cyclotransferase
MARRKQVKKTNKQATADVSSSNAAAPDAKPKKSMPASAQSSTNWKLIAGIIFVGAIAVLLSLYGEEAPEIERSVKEKTPSSKSSTTNDSVNNNRMPPLRVYDHYEVLEEMPHDPKSFTQGLTYGNNKLWEGTGNYGESEIRHIEPETGKTLYSTKLDKKYFGEGISYYEHPKEKRLFQLSWREKTGWIYNCDTFELDTEFKYETTTGEGWGITHVPERNEFIVTDGSEYLHFWDAETLQEKKKLIVQFTNPADGTVRPVGHLNEVEYVGDGYLLSNVWYQDVLIKINIDTGMVEQVYNFNDLYVDRAKGVDCFNGISVTDKPGEFWVTGKWWPMMYRVKLLV